MPTISEVGFATSFSVLFAITSIFCFIRFYLDVQRCLLLPSKAHIASLASFFVGWAFFVVVVACNLWKINKGLAITERGRPAILYVPTADVDYPDVEMSQKACSLSSSVVF